jgi:pyruvate dehydrogenase E2 component (dihydrolipoamide acetyltransferase)
MAEFYEMPQASPTMEAGRIIAWRKAEGDKLSPQDIIAEVETDKAAMDIEVFDECYLLKILAPADAEVPAGRPIAIMGTSADEDVSALLAEFDALSTGAAGSTDTPATAEAPSATSSTANPRPAPTAAAAAAPTAPAPAGLRPYTWRGESVHEAIMEMPGSYLPSEAPPGFVATGRVRAAPAARQAALSRGVDLRNVKGTGPRGRVLKADVEHAPVAPAHVGSTTVGRGPAADTVVRNSPMRKTIARRLASIWQEAPVFYLTAVFDCDALVPFRAALKAGGRRVSYNDVLIKACALALREVPEVNASWGADAITRHGDVNIGVAVALDDGLITPVVRNADQKGLSLIGDEVRELAGRARLMKLKPDEYTGSTFTISNLGMMDIEHFTAILNPPEAVILAVGGMQQEPVVVDGALTVGWRMRVTLTCDHRVVDGALGARFLQALRAIVENPALLAG